MIQKPDPLIDELYRVEGKAEIVGGRIVPMSPAGGRHGLIVKKILASLIKHEEKHGGGVCLGDNVGFIVSLPGRKSFSPDLAWVIGTEDDLDSKFINGAPAFAVEVRSEGDYGPTAERRILRKINDYFAAGTQVVWDVDLLSDDIIKCYRASAPHEPECFRSGDKADAEPAIPGWKFEVSKLIGK